MGLIRRLRRGKDARVKFVSSHLDKTVAFQLRTIREQQQMSQGELAAKVGMNQNAISRLESEWYGKPTIRTLKRLAAALDVALVVRFVPFSQLVNWVSGTPFEDTGLSAETLAVPNFDQEERVGNLDEPTIGAASFLNTMFQEGIVPSSGGPFTPGIYGMPFFGGMWIESNQVERAYLPAMMSSMIGEYDPALVIANSVQQDVQELAKVA